MTDILLTPSQIPAIQRAIVQAASAEPGTLELCANQPVPQILPEQVLVRVVAVALNPCDWKMPTNIPCPGAVDGSDYSGIIVKIGEAARSHLKIGDRVAGAQHASNPSNPRSGTFTEYIAVYSDQLWRLPGNMSWEEGAALGWAVVGSVGLALFKALKLPGSPEQPVQKDTYALVFGGATASGTMAIQLLRLSGCKVVTTCSPNHFELVESYGAEKAFDYNSSTCGEDIRKYTKNTLQYALDIITEARTLRHCYAAIGRGGGRYIGFELIPEELTVNMRKTVKADWVLGIEMSGFEIALPGGYHRKPNPELRAWGCEWFKRFEALIQAGKIRSHPVKLNEGGLDAVIAGVERMKRREVRGEKLVYMLGPSDAKGVQNSTFEAMNRDDCKGWQPSMQKRLKILGQNQIAVDKHGVIPHMREDEILVRVIYTAVNPVDAKSADLSPALGATPGCDFSGEVTKIGDAVKRKFVVGDHVCGFVFGDNPGERENGAFAEYVTIPGNLVFKIPPWMSLQCAATVGIAVGTAGMALYHVLKLPLPRFQTSASASESPYILVYGGGTATGKIAIQLLRMSGMIPVTTCSPRNFGRAKSLGAAETFDYMSTTCVSDIRAFTNNSIEHVFDCISDTRSTKICQAAFGSRGGLCVALDPPPARALSRHDVRTEWIILFTAFGKSVLWAKPFLRDPQPQDREFAEDWYRLAQGLLDDHALQLPALEERAGGFEGLIDGIDQVRRGKVVGSKLVYRLGELK